MDTHSDGLLDDLWKGRLEVLATNLATGGREHLEIASVARHIEADYAGRFLIELLQNSSDQAQRAEASTSTVHIVRAPGVVAVTNEGAPFDDVGAKAITELGLSPKDAGFALGNKGVGFKSVFQVSSAPEICSGAALGRDFLDSGYRLRFDSDPFKGPSEAARLEDLVHQLFERRADLPDRIRDRCRCADPRAELMTHARLSAPFRFPLALSDAQVRDRIAHLALPEIARRAATLVVLPIRDDDTAREVVNKALDEVFADGAEMLLFLRGVDRLVLLDHPRERQAVFTRAEGPKRLVERGTRRHHLVERTLRVARGSGEPTSRSWLVVERTLGDDSFSQTAELAAHERSQIHAKAQRLRHENWKKVDRARVGVALPLPDGSAPHGAPLPPDGRFCIGLPTLDGTGTPLWIDASYHGTISRKGIDFGEPYNEFLFEEAVSLTSDLIAALREDPARERRRLTALALHRDGKGRFVDELCRAPDGLARAAIVLAADGRRFLRPSQLAAPARADLGIFELLEEAAGDIERFGFILPDRALLERARDVLDELPGSTTAMDADKARYLRRQGGSSSLVEAAAKGLRAEPRPGAFERFLKWICLTFQPSELDDQVILPVGERDLAARRERVFLRPIPRSAARGDKPVDQSAPSEAEDLEPEDLPADVRVALRFIDEAVVPIRVSERDLSALARLLAPESGGGLVKHPRIPEVLDEALAPRLQEAAKRGDHDLALRLLETALRWLATLSPKSRARVHTEWLRVPVLDRADNLRWVQPINAVFGRGWLGGRQEELLLRIYVDDEGRLLVPWDDLAKRLAKHGNTDPPQVAFWREQLQMLRVWSAPRVLTARTSSPPFRAHWNHELIVAEGSCPFPGLNDIWRTWLDTIRKLRVPTRSGQEYGFKNGVQWIEHLDSPERRADVVEAMLRRPDGYMALNKITLQRTLRGDYGYDPHQVIALWAHALRDNDWPVIPTTNHDIVPARRAFRLERDEAVRYAERHAFLPHPGIEFDKASDLLEALGVPRLSDASPQELLGALHELADALPVIPERERPAHALAADLYQRLQTACHNAPDEDLSAILARPVPLERGRRLEAVDLAAIDHIYVADDPVRFRLLRPDKIFAVPLPAGTTAAALVSRLRDALGSPSRVVLASEASISSGFQPDHPTRRPLLLAALGDEFPDAEVESDLACIIAYLGRHPQQPSGEAFSKAWRRLRATELVRGHFHDDFPHTSLLQEAPDAPPKLFVRSDLKRGELVEAVWAAVGITHRDVFALYARALDNGVAAVERFFAERSVGPAERAEVEAVLGKTPGVWLQPLRPLFLVAWRKGHPGAGVDQFLAQWAQSAASLHALDAFTGVSGLSTWLQKHRHMDIEQLVEQALNDLALEADALAQATADLGADLVFEKARRAWERQRTQLIASIMAITARKVRVDPGAARAIVESLRHEGIPAHLERQPRHDQRVHGALLALLRDRLTSLPPGTQLDAIAALVANDSSPNTALRFALPQDVSDREVNEFADRDEETRAADSAEVLADLLAVAARLASLRGAALDEDVIRSDPRVALLSGGFFANRYALLNALGDALARSQPEITQILREAGAFREPLKRHVLAKHLHVELEPEGSPAPAQPSVPINIAGVQIKPDELDADLALGSAGRVGQGLVEAARIAGDQLDFSALRARSRGTATAPERSKGKRRKRGSGKTHSEARKERERIGLLGEIFAFELLRQKLDDFDQANWRSEGRNGYGFEVPGADEAGSDFDWVDRKGQLTGRDDSPRCLIEVKSTADDDPDGPFHMSINQWNVAQMCHRSNGREVYVILRVINVATTPELAEMLIDPVQMELKKQLVLSQSEMWVWAGELTLSGEPTQDPEL